jgi:hypothetical protein
MSDKSFRLSLFAGLANTVRDAVDTFLLPEFGATPGADDFPGVPCFRIHSLFP